MCDVQAILLAAGQSRRMGARNKLLLPFNGVPMIRHMVRTYQSVTGRPVLVVTGHDADAVTSALDNIPAKIVFNPDFAGGQQTSVGCGLRAATSTQTVMIALGDQPLLSSADIHALLSAHRGADPHKISIPQHAGRRGNPIVIPNNLVARILRDPHAPGCKKFTHAHPEHVQFHSLPQAGFYADIDTPADYAALNLSRDVDAV